MKRRWGSERGAVAPLVAVVMLGLLAITALVVDGGVMFAARRDLQGLADSSARAGAMAVDQRILRQTGQVQLDAALADQAVRDYLASAGFHGSLEIQADTSAVTVDLSEERPTVMMGLVGIRTMRTQAHVVARPRAGIETPEG